MNNETVKFIESKGKFGMKLGLENITRLMDKLGNPQDKLTFIHVAGSNGKGSVCRILENTLIENNYHPGLYTSPHLEKFNERIRYNGENISEDDLNRLFLQVKTACDALENEGFAYPTGFEIETAIAFLYFLEKNVDLVILEVGLGGRLDATNVIKNSLVSIITSISLEHTQWLGKTLEAIAREKAAIIKEGSHVVIAPQNKEAEIALTEEANKRGAQSIAKLKEDMVKVSGHTLDTLEFDILGEPFHSEISGAIYQKNNLLTAQATLEVLKTLGYNLDSSGNILGKNKIPGRFEILSKDPIIIIDGAHNPDGIRALSKSLRSLFGDKKITYFFGCLEDKHVEESIKTLLVNAKKMYLLKPENPEALSPEKLKKIIYKEDPDLKTEILTNPEEIVKHLNLKSKNNIYVVTGSLYLIGPVRTILRKLLSRS